MSEMVDRAAKAIEAEIFKIEVGSTPQKRLENAARAAISAMREPTHEMVMRTAMQGESPMITALGPISRIAHHWRLMIEEALK